MEREKREFIWKIFREFLKICNFIEFDVPNFNFATSYVCRLRRHIENIVPKKKYLLSPSRPMS